MLGARRTALISLVSVPAFFLACNSIVGFDDLVKQQGQARPADAGGAGDDDVTDDDDVTALPDGGKAPPRCDPKKPFGTPFTVDIGADQTKETKRGLMTSDELELFYLRGASAPFELRHARRSARVDAAGDPVPWSESTTEALSPAAVLLTSLVLGGKKLVYWSVENSSGTMVTTTFTASRPIDGAFSTGARLGGNGERPYTVSENDDTAYWSKIMTIDGSSDYVLHRGNVQGAGIVGATELPNLHHVPSLDDNPVISANQRVIYFSSQRKIATALGADDIYRASRNATNEDFGAPQNVTELNSAGPDEPSWVSGDDCVILFDRSRHITMAIRPL